MKIFSQIISHILNSIYPLTPEDKILFSFTPTEAYNVLPKSKTILLKEVQAVFNYKDDIVTRLVWNIKYKKSKKAISIGAYALSQSLSNNFLNGNYDNLILIPIPITKRRRHERGFNQCELLVKEIIWFMSENHIQTDNCLLNRVIHRDRQTLKNRSDRINDSKGVFEVNMDALNKYLFPNKNEYSLKNNAFIVIDDVITTGSTISEAMQVLKQANLKNVHGLALAH